MKKIIIKFIIKYLIWNISIDTIYKEIIIKIVFFKKKKEFLFILFYYLILCIYKFVNNYK